jgi:hypothetical protein
MTLILLVRLGQGFLRHPFGGLRDLELDLLAKRPLPDPSLPLSALPFLTLERCRINGLRGCDDRRLGWREALPLSAIRAARR